MLEMCRQYYRGHRKQLKLIDKFERDYRPENAIRWYSKQSFVYQLINKALRTEDIDQLHIFRFFIGDLSESLAREHQQMIQSGEKTLIVYRGTKLSNIELEQFKEKKGQLISTNGFLSTSRCRSRALAFAQKPTKRSDAIPILFEINCDIQQLRDSVIFADIQKLSEYPEEEEILFDLSATFQINHVEYDGTIWTIQMAASSEGQAIVQDYIEVIRRETVEWSVKIMFGRLICHMGQYEKSQRYFEQLLTDTNEDPALIEINIGRVLHFKGEWTDARKYYDRVCERMMNADPSRVKDSAFALNNIGDLLRLQGNYDEAINFYQQALTIREQYYPADHPNISVTISNIGRLLENQKKYDEALIYHRKALIMREKYYPNGDPNIARSFNNIGHILNNQGKHYEALDFCHRALSMYKKHYSSGHPLIAATLNNIGDVLYNQQIYDEALQYYQKALTMQEKYFPNDHPDIAKSLSNIAHVLDNQKKYENAFESYQLALIVFQRYYPHGHPEMAAILHNIGKIYEIYNQSEKALHYYQRALTICSNNVPIDPKIREKIEKNIHRLS